MTDFEKLILDATTAMVRKPYNGDLELLNKVVSRVLDNKLEKDPEVTQTLADIKTHTLKSQHEMVIGKLIRLFGLIKEFEIKDIIKFKSVFKVSNQYVHITQNSIGDVVQMSLFTQDIDELHKLEIQ